MKHAIYNSPLTISIFLIMFSAFMMPTGLIALDAYWPLAVGCFSLAGLSIIGVIAICLPVGSNEERE